MTLWCKLQKIRDQFGKISVPELSHLIRWKSNSFLYFNHVLLYEYNSDTNKHTKILNLLDYPETSKSIKKENSFSFCYDEKNQIIYVLMHHKLISIFRRRSSRELKICVLTLKEIVSKYNKYEDTFARIFLLNSKIMVIIHNKGYYIYNIDFPRITTIENINVDNFSYQTKYFVNYKDNLYYLTTSHMKLIQQDPIVTYKNNHTIIQFNETINYPTYNYCICCNIDNQYIFVLSDGNIFIIDSCKQWKCYKSVIHTPIKCNLPGIKCCITTQITRELDFKVISGYSRLIMCNIPGYLIQLINQWYCNEYLHLFCHKKFVMWNTHWKIHLDLLLENIEVE